MLGRKLANKINLVALSVGGEQIHRVCMWCGVMRVCFWVYMRSWGGQTEKHRRKKQRSIVI